MAKAKQQSQPKEVVQESTGAQTVTENPGTSTASPEIVTNPLPTTTTESGKKVALPGVGIYGDVVVVDRKELHDVLRNLLQGYTEMYAGMGLITSVGKMFREKDWNKSKQLLNEITGG